MQNEFPPPEVDRAEIMESQKRTGRPDTGPIETTEAPNYTVKKELFDELLESVKQAIAIERGQIKPSRSFTVSGRNDIKAVRSRLGLSQNRFAALLGVSSATLKTGSKAGAALPARRKCCLRLPRDIPKSFWKLRLSKNSFLLLRVTLSHPLHRMQH